MRFVSILLAAAALHAQQTTRSYLERIAFDELAARKQKVAAIQTREQFEHRRAEVRKQLAAMMGGLPNTRAPLNLRNVGEIDRGDYRIEKIIFESLPRFYVTANLFVPKTGTPPYAAVVQPVGHSVAAKARAFYQNLGLGLVKNGFVVLTYDPIGQGERRLFYDRDLGDSKVGGTTTEHSMVGIQSLLAGESIARYMVWDGMRAIDVLQSLPYVNPKRIGVSGCSGGGTLTAYLAALDDRVQAAAPSCYITDWEDQLPGTGPQDAEQQFPDQFKLGLNHPDLVEAFAPRPYLICSTTEDFFPIAGSRKTFDEAKRIWGLFGAEQRIATSYDGGPHGTTKKQREAIYAWMKRWLQDRPGPVEAEPQFQTEYEEDMLCTPTGQVSTSLGGETASTLNVSRFSTIVPQRPVPQIREKILGLTRYEPGTLPLAATVIEPLQPRRKAVIYIGERADADRLAGLGYTVLMLQPEAPADRVTWLGLMVGKPVVGLQMDEIIRGIDMLRDRGLLFDNRCIGFAKGNAGVALLHAAVLDPRISAVAIEGGLISYAAAARTPVHKKIFDAVIPAVLGSYDLRDLAGAITPRPVSLVNVRSPVGETVRLHEAEQEYGSVKNVRLGLRREAEDIAAAYPELR